ncbi:ABC transporter permease subunit [Roseomonas sp. OT10]|uniref:amino acid ABC transporter permease n=1 Tax=Roseomonas cutis TaxID=2897332 RepID=UPI001E5ADA7A|nr:ABC transporter permease subunit [Roseomonas sp. OT10]UFN49883.1 ABC transporter permease subunit [Roseomonas sp. OT10]
MSGWENFAFTFLNGAVMATYLPAIAAGFVVTVELAALVVTCGLALGLALAVLRALLTDRRGGRWMALPILFLVDLFRAVPPLVLVVLFFFGLPAAGAELSGFAATWLALTLVLMAFAEEIFWAGITAVPRGQPEAAAALGLRPVPVLFLVVLPQAVRMVIPPLTNRTIAITKNTALGSVAGVSEILGASQSAVAFAANPSPLILGAAAYLLLFIPVVCLGRWIEARYAVRTR